MDRRPVGRSVMLFETVLLSPDPWARTPEPGPLSPDPWARIPKPGPWTPDPDPGAIQSGVRVQEDRGACLIVRRRGSTLTKHGQIGCDNCRVPVSRRHFPITLVAGKMPEFGQHYNVPHQWGTYPGQQAKERCLKTWGSTLKYPTHPDDMLFVIPLWEAQGWGVRFLFCGFERGPAWLLWLPRMLYIFKDDSGLLI